MKLILIKELEIINKVWNNQKKNKKITKNKRKQMAILKINIRKRAELEELEIERANKIKELKLSPYWFLISLWK